MIGLHATQKLFAKLLIDAAEHVGWISAAHPPMPSRNVADALRLSTLRLFWEMVDALCLSTLRSKEAIVEQVAAG